jgi:hypothetical protein
MRLGGIDNPGGDYLWICNNWSVSYIQGVQIKIQILCDIKEIKLNFFLLFSGRTNNSYIAMSKF